MKEKADMKRKMKVVERNKKRLDAKRCGNGTRLKNGDVLFS